jgi:hypothetical protein
MQEKETKKGDIESVSSVRIHTRKECRPPPYILRRTLREVLPYSKEEESEPTLETRSKALQKQVQSSKEKE